jgi:cobalt-zinc-cadmium efflux system membrane fusion protein
MRKISNLQKRGALGALIALATAGGFLMLREGAETHEQPVAVRQAIRSPRPATLALSPQLAASMQIRTQLVEPAQNRRVLRLPGSFFLDSSRLVRVRSRFEGEVVAIGTKHEQSLSEAPIGGAGPERQLRFGDKVTKGQLLAVVWSKEVGEKKSELLDAYSSLNASELELNRLKSLERGTVPEKTIRESMRLHEAHLIAVDRIELTLRSWRISEADIAKVRDEVGRINLSNHSSDDIVAERRWAEVDIRAPFAGVITEKNVTVGDLTDPQLVMFKIADVSRLGVLAHAYEDDLRVIASLPPEDRTWCVRIKGEPNACLPGHFEVVGNFIDPNQHAGAVVGWLDNSDERHFVGQFVTCEIELPADETEVVVPVNAVVDEGAYSTVFIASDPDAHEVERRQVALVRRGSDVVYLRAVPTDAERSQGCAEIPPGSLVVTGGVVELSAALDELSTAAAEPQSVLQ